MLLALSLVLAAQMAEPRAHDAAGGVAARASPIAAAPAPEEHALVELPSPSAPSGTLGGLSGAAGGCAAGMGLPVVVISAGSGILAWLYSGAAAGTIIGVTPALTALGTSGGMCGAALCLPVVGAGAATAGAMYGAEQDGRDPLPALLGALPGLGLAGIATILGLVAIGVGVAGSIGALQPVAILVAIAAVLGIAAPPCSACGAGVADLAWGNGVDGAAREAPAGAADPARPATMRF